MVLGLIQSYPEKQQWKLESLRAASEAESYQTNSLKPVAHTGISLAEIAL